jgi:hypothetical protein
MWISLGASFKIYILFRQYQMDVKDIKCPLGGGGNMNVCVSVQYN